MATKFVARDHVVFCELGEGVALLDTDKNTYFSLNSTGSLIWQKLSTQVSIAELSGFVAEVYEVCLDKCATDVENLLQALLQASLVEVIEGDETETHSYAS